MIKASLTPAEEARFRKWIRFKIGETRFNVQNLVVKHTEDMVRMAKEAAPTNKSIGAGGRMRASIVSAYSTNRLGSRVWVDANYAAHVEFGTRPHLIFPKIKPVLAWRTYTTTGKKGQQLKRARFTGWAYARFVRHPGTKPQPFFFKAFEKTNKNFINDLRRLGFREA